MFQNRKYCYIMLHSFNAIMNAYLIKAFQIFPFLVSLLVTWCILKCILIKFQGKNSLKISVFIATTTKLLGRYWACSPGKMNAIKTIDIIPSVTNLR